MIKAKTVAAWILALAIGAAPSVGLGQGQKTVKPVIPEEIKKILSKDAESEKERQRKRDQALPEPIRDEKIERIDKEIPS